MAKTCSTAYTEIQNHVERLQDQAMVTLAVEGEGENVF